MMRMRHPIKNVAGSVLRLVAAAVAATAADQ
jgi:hypothetical protein